MLTLFVVVALMVGAAIAGELVRGQCRRMLSRPHPSVLAVQMASAAEAGGASERAVSA
jgi:hypothetical protein